MSIPPPYKFVLMFGVSYASTRYIIGPAIISLYEYNTRIPHFHDDYFYPLLVKNRNKSASQKAQQEKKFTEIHDINCPKVEAALIECFNQVGAQGGETVRKNVPLVGNPKVFFANNCKGVKKIANEKRYNSTTHTVIYPLYEIDKSDVKRLQKNKSVTYVTVGASDTDYAWVGSKYESDQMMMSRWADEARSGNIV